MKLRALLRGSAWALAALGIGGCTPPVVSGPDHPASAPPAAADSTPPTPERFAPPVAPPASPSLRGLTEPWGELPSLLAAPPRFGAPVETALALMERDAALFAYEKDFKERDVWRLEVVDRLLADAPRALDLLDDAPADLDPMVRLGQARSLLELPVSARPERWPSPGVLEVADLLAGLPADSPWRSHGASLAVLSRELPVFLAALEVATADVVAAYAGLDGADRERMTRIVRGLPIEVPGPDLEPLMALLERVDVEAALRAGEVLTEASIALASALQAGIPAGDVADRSFWSPIVLEHPAGTIIIAGPGDDVHREAAVLVVDLGGDDLYQGVDPDPQSHIGVTIDLSGDDIYRGEHTGGAALGVLAVALALDVEGDDLYASPGPGPAAAAGGFALLLDLEGDDRYTAERMSQGAAIAGVALLVDGAGDDAYGVSVFGQGFGGPGGFGLLLDGGGRDRYVAGQVAPDHREPTRAFHSFSQGYAMGLRAYRGTTDLSLASGGVGWLEDLGGDDVYVASYFAQGASYWYGLGTLVDRAGNDRYLARRYSQGAGVHASVGLLDDRAGDDRYLSWGVSQGVGHDLAVGWLRDGAGDDRYQGEWMVQGVGNENGIGILLDEAGADRYEAHATEAQGWAGEARGAIGLGWLLDGAGEDHYEGPARPPLWKPGSYGLGLDLEGPVHGETDSR